MTYLIIILLFCSFKDKPLLERMQRYAPSKAGLKYPFLV